jgi:CO/xanthine dehydrogenase Mo-binding subunit
LIGIGVASATYPAYQAPSSARVRLLANGTAEVEVAASDMGPGTCTSMTQVAAETLGLSIEKVRFSLGRSDFPEATPWNPASKRRPESFAHVFARYPSPENWESDDRIHRGPPLLRKARSGAGQSSERSNRANSP